MQIFDISRKYIGDLARMRASTPWLKSTLRLTEGLSVSGQLSASAESQVQDLRDHLLVTSGSGDVVIH